MEKENRAIADIREHTGRITRSRAAGACASRQIQPVKAPMQVDQKLSSRVNPKRAALDDKNTHMCPRRKKRAVLQDISNVGFQNSNKGLPNGTKIQPKNVKPKQTHKAQSNVSKECSSVAAVSTTQFQAGPKTEMVQEKVMCGSTKLEENVPSESDIRSECVKDIGMLKKHAAALSSQPYRSLKKESSLFGDLIGSRNPDIPDIDSDLSNPLLCSLYVSDIYNNLRVAELVRRPYCDFMEMVQRDITQGMRGILVDWLVEVSEEYKLVPDTLYLTVYLIDTFLAQNYIERQRLQLLGITCMLIASKYEEICAPRVEEFCFITDNTYSREEVLKMESEVLKYFGFQLFTPTAKTFLRRFLRAAQVSYKSPSLELEHLANYLAELTLMDYGFLSFVPSVIAASAVFLARWTLDQTSHPWNPTLEYYTSYKASELQTSVQLLQDLQLNTHGCPLNAVRMKYRQDKFKSVAALSSSKLLETLF